jgi:hypothetical protein
MSESKIAMLRERIQHLETALRQTTELLETMVYHPNVHNISSCLDYADDLVEENLAILEGEFED